MPTHYRNPVLTCDNCGATALRPVGSHYRDGWRTLHDQGWRTKGNPNEEPLRFTPHTILVSCPTCPPVAN